MELEGMQQQLVDRIKENYADYQAKLITKDPQELNGREAPDTQAGQRTSCLPIGPQQQETEIQKAAS